MAFTAVVGLGAAAAGAGTLAAIGAGLFAANTVSQQRSAKRQAAATQEAAAQAQVNADKQAQAADQANNRANQRRANVSGAMDAALLSGRAGVSSTMLTGPQGVDPSQLQLGKNTLLGS